MKNFDLKKYLAEGRLLKENVMDDFLEDVMAGAGDDVTVYKYEMDDMYGDDKSKNHFDRIQSMVKGGTTSHTRDLGDSKYSYSLSVGTDRSGDEFIKIKSKDIMSEGKLLKEELIWKVEGESADISDAGPEYRADVESQIKQLHPDISDEDLAQAIDISNGQFHNSAREASRSGEGRIIPLSSDDFVVNTVEIYQTDIMTDDQYNDWESKK
jgi:hypothetical protein